MAERPQTGASVWRGSELVARGSEPSWIEHLSDAEIRDLDAGIAAAARTGKPLNALEASDFGFGPLRDATDRWLQELAEGRGFLLVRGIPVDRYSLEQVSLAYVGLGLHMGTAVPQNPAGDLLGHVRDTGASAGDPATRLYKTRVSLGFHCDGSDLVGLLCLKPARRGGKSYIVSSATVFNEVVQRRPDLAPLLREPFCFDRNDEQPDGEPPFFALPLCLGSGDEFRFFYIGWYIRGAQRHAEVPRLTADQTALLDLIDEIAEDPSIHLAMDFQPGDIQWLKNSMILHAREDYEDHPEPEKKRHLLRLWLTARRRFAEADPFVQQGIPAKQGVESDAQALARTLK